MARTLEMKYKLEFSAPIRGHHIYKDNWWPKIGEELNCQKDNREDAIQYDKFSIGVFKNEELVGHIPSEISELLTHFIQNSPKNKMIAFPIGKRKREIGLVVPAKYMAICENKKVAQILMEKLLEKQKILDIRVQNALKCVPIFTK